MIEVIKYIKNNCYKFFIHVLLMILFLLIIASMKDSYANGLNYTDYNIQITNSHIENKHIKYKPKIRIYTHKGGHELNHYEMRETIKAVVDIFDIIENKEKIEKLIYETMIVETRLGKAKYDYASNNYRNYGIAQIRTETAQDLKNYLKNNNKKDYINLMSLYDRNHSEKDNLLYNVPYSIAVCGLYYIRRDKNISYKINSLSDRAKAWKKHYNTYKGLGTVAIYQKRVKQSSKY